MQSVKVSVIIPVYNASLLLTRCLDSVFQQNAHADIEVICINDGSTDNSEEIIKAYDGSIILLQQKNQGPAAARNKGIQKASGKYLAFLDADDFWEPSFLKETIAFMEQNQQAIAVSVGQKHNTVNSEQTIVPSILQSSSNPIKEPMLIPDFFGFWAEHSHICSGSILIKTSVAKQTKGQRPELRVTEDLEFWAYLGTMGSIGFIPKVLFTSDGISVTQQQGWIRKNKKRWASAPSVESWESRILPAVTDTEKTSFQTIRGKIAKQLCYSMIMSKRSEQARQTIKKYGTTFPTDKVSRLLNIGAKNHFFWLLVTTLITVREYVRQIS